MFIAWTISCLECVIHSWTNKHMLDWMMIDWDIRDHNCDSISDSYLFLAIYHSKCSSSSSSSSRCLAIHSLFLDDWYRGTLPNLGKASLFLDKWVLLHPYFCVLHPITWMYSYYVGKMLSILPINIWKNQKKKPTTIHRCPIHQAPQPRSHHLRPRSPHHDLRNRSIDRSIPGSGWVAVVGVVGSQRQASCCCCCCCSRSSACVCVAACASIEGMPCGSRRSVCNSIVLSSPAHCTWRVWSWTIEFFYSVGETCFEGEGVCFGLGLGLEDRWYLGYSAIHPLLSCRKHWAWRVWNRGLEFVFRLLGRAKTCRAGRGGRARLGWVSCRELLQFTYLLFRFVSPRAMDMAGME